MKNANRLVLALLSHCACAQAEPTTKADAGTHSVAAKPSASRPPFSYAECSIGFVPVWTPDGWQCPQKGTPSIMKAAPRPGVLPPLLHQPLSAHGGAWFVCPPRNEFEAQQSSTERDSAASPELTRRLTEEFPPGTSADQLLRALVEQGFNVFGACQNEAAIRMASFRQLDTPPSTFPLHAQVAWKQNDEGRVEWIKGTIAYDAP